MRLVEYLIFTINGQINIKIIDISISFSEVPIHYIGTDDKFFSAQDGGFISVLVTQNNSNTLLNCINL